MTLCITIVVYLFVILLHLHVYLVLWQAPSITPLEGYHLTRTCAVLSVERDIIDLMRHVRLAMIIAMLENIAMVVEARRMANACHARMVL